MGMPDNPSQDTKQAWIHETIATAKENQVDRGDLGRELLLSIAGEIGYFKVIALLLLFLLSVVWGTIFGAMKMMQKAADSKGRA